MSNQLKNNQYYLELNENCYPNITPGEILQLEKDSNLSIEILNGYKTTNQIYLLSNINKNFSFSFQEKITNPDILISEENISKYSIPPKEITTSIKYEIHLKKSGPMIFFFIYTDNDTKNQIKTMPFYINVLPKIEISKNLIINLKNIRLLTVLSKSLGNIDEFEKIFIEAKLLNYNFIHFTPVQELGSTDSSYSIKNHTDISDYFFLNNKHLLDSNQKYELLQNNIKKYSTQYKIGTVIDIILHQTSSNSPWLYKHPECGYNLINTPWLNCAYDLDNILQEYSNKFALSQTKLKFQPYCRDEKELNLIINDISDIIENASLYEYFMINVDLMGKNLSKYYDENIDIKNNYNDEFEEKDMLNFLYSECLYGLGEERNGVLIDLDKYEKCLLYLINISENKEKFLESMKKLVNNCNEKWKNNFDKMIANSIQNIKTDINMNFILNGNNQSNIISHPLIMPYFAKLKINEKDKNKIFACNGLLLKENTNDIIEEILSLPSIYNYVKNDIYYYFQRKILIWSDTAKLKYPYNPHDSHFLIRYMTNYVQDMAQLFNGFVLRDIDSVPVTITQYLMKKAREINPNLLIISKINNRENEIELINKIGINLLIKELIICNNNNDLINNLKNYNENINNNEKIFYSYTKNNLIKKKYLLSNKPYNIIFDLTHENITYYQKEKNLCLNLTNMFCCSISNTAIGSTKGFDELYPFQPSMVNEKRKYFYDKSFFKVIEKEENPGNDTNLDKKIKVKFELKNTCNTVHLALSNRDWLPDIKMIKIGDLFSTEVLLPINKKIYYKYVINSYLWICDENKDKEKDDKGNINNYILVKEEEEEKKEKDHYNDLKILRRELNKIRNKINNSTNNFYFKEQNEFLYSFKNLNDFSGYAFICHSGYKNENKNENNKITIEIPGIYEEFVVGCSIINIGNIKIDEFKNNEYIGGIKSDIFCTQEENYFKKYCNINVDENNNKTILIFNEADKIPSNTLFVIKYNFNKLIKNAFISIDNSLLQMEKEWSNISKKMNIADINYILYNNDKGGYNIENYGKLKYDGISHIHKILNESKFISNDNKNDKVLNYICKNDSLFKFIVDRLNNKNNFKDIFSSLSEIYNNYIKLPIDYKITYLTKIINCLYNITILKLFDIYSNEALINYYSPFTQNLLRAIPQFISNNEKGNFLFNNFKSNNELSNKKSILTNVREIFISFKGIFLIPGLYDEAKNILTYFSSKMKNGIIPNIIKNNNNKKNFKYNSKDVTWLYLKSILDYIEFTKDYDFLLEKIKIESNEIPLYEIIQEILQKHINGISINEDDNFFDANIDKKNGFIYGGNKNNCGTWMDDINESGKPYTPRDGINIEIVSLVYYVLTRINYLYSIGKYKYDYVLLNEDNQFKFSQWINKIRNNFENYFYNDYKTNKNYKQNIYKDYISSNDEKDPFQYQLRPNVFIALALSPELFNKDHVLKYISKAEKLLIEENSLGIKTLSINDKNYISNIDNKNKNNLHNGIEWLFLYSYYLMAKHIFENNNKKSKKYTYKIYEKLILIQKYLSKSEWSSLPAYILSKNDICPNSMSISAFLELIEFLKISKNSNKNNEKVNSTHGVPKRARNKCLFKARSNSDLRVQKNDRKVSYNEENINNISNTEENDIKNISNKAESARDIIEINQNKFHNSVKNALIDPMQIKKSAILKKAKEPIPNKVKNVKQLNININENVINDRSISDNDNNIKLEKPIEIKETKNKINHCKTKTNTKKRSDNILNKPEIKTKKVDNNINTNEINSTNEINNSNENNNTNNINNINNSINTNEINNTSNSNSNINSKINNNINTNEINDTNKINNSVNINEINNANKIHNTNEINNNINTNEINDNNKINNTNNNNININISNNININEIYNTDEINDINKINNTNEINDNINTNEINDTNKINNTNEINDTNKINNTNEINDNININEINDANKINNVIEINNNINEINNTNKISNITKTIKNNTNTNNITNNINSNTSNIKNNINNTSDIKDNDIINNPTPSIINNKTESNEVKEISNKVRKKIFINERKKESKKTLIKKKPKDPNNDSYEKLIINRFHTEKDLFSSTKIKLQKNSNRNKKTQLDDTSNGKMYYNLVRSFDLMTLRKNQNKKIEKEKEKENNEEKEQQQEKKNYNTKREKEKTKIKEGEGLLDLDPDITDMFINSSSLTTNSKKNIIPKKKKIRKKKSKKNKNDLSISTPDTSNLVSISTDFNNLVAIGTDPFDPSHTPENSYSKNMLCRHKGYSSNLMIDTSDDFLNNNNSEEKSNDYLENNAFPIIKNKDNENIYINDDMEKNNDIDYINENDMNDFKKLGNKLIKGVLYEKKILGGNERINKNRKTVKNLTIKDFIESSEVNRDIDKK